MGWFPQLEVMAQQTSLPVDIIKIVSGLTAVILISNPSISKVPSTEHFPAA